jgi:hypothetical protein
MITSRQLRAAVLALSFTVAGALTACGSLADGSGGSTETPATTQPDPKVGEHLAQKSIVASTTAPVHTCGASDCRFGPR